jgi:hypothetical protein
MAANAVSVRAVAIAVLRAADICVAEYGRMASFMKMKNLLIVKFGSTDKNNFSFLEADGFRAMCRPLTGVNG